ncbi:hypothetical protein SAMN05444271_13144, partial [Halohasta litchfieldiae]
MDSWISIHPIDDAASVGSMPSQSTGFAYPYQGGLHSTDNILLYEGVIESVTHEDAGCWNCVYERQHPARGDFYRR